MGLPGNWTIEQILTLTYYKSVNFTVLRQAVENFSSLEHLIESAIAENIFAKLRQQDLFEEQRIDITDEINRQLDTCEKNNFRIVTYWDEEYPALLKKITHPPIVLFVRGTLQKNDAAAISVVGTRRCTTYGKLSTERFTEEFARRGVVVVSGLAYGIDTTAHLAALRAKGITYAVIACGLDQIFPDTSQKNADKIIDGGGAIISEYKCGVKALPAYFPQRNRIISGISFATLVAESGEKGGALITAKFAMDQEREVFAVPGNISSAKSVGTNQLIKNQRAIPALTPDGVLKELGLDKQAPELISKSPAEKMSDPVQLKIYEALDYEPIHIDKLSDDTGIEMSDLLVKLLDMEFNGLIRQLPGKTYIRGD